MSVREWSHIDVSIDVDASDHRTPRSCLRHAEPVPEGLIVTAAEHEWDSTTHPHRRDGRCKRTLPCEHIILGSRNIPRIKERERTRRRQV